MTATTLRYAMMLKRIVNSFSGIAKLVILDNFAYAITVRPYGVIELVGYGMWHGYGYFTATDNNNTKNKRKKY